MAVADGPTGASPASPDPSRGPGPDSGPSPHPDTHPDTRPSPHPDAHQKPAPGPALVPRIPAWAVLALAAALFLGDHLLLGRAFLLRDRVFDFVPWREYAGASIRAGDVPLWNPYSRFGQPFVAEPQSAFFYPSHWLHAFLPAALAFELGILLHLFVGAAGTWLLLGRLGLRAPARMLGAVVQAFGAYTIANLEFESVTETLAWVPLSMCLTLAVGDSWSDSSGMGTRVRLRRGALPAAGLAAVLAVQWLAGQAQTMGYGLFAAVVLAAIAGRARVVALATLAGAMVVATCIAAVQLLPTAELLPHSIRAGSVDAGLDVASLPPWHLSSLLFAFSAGWPGREHWWGDPLPEYWLGALHIGIAPLVLVTFAPLTRRRRVLVAAAVLVVTGLLIAFGRFTPVYGWLHDLVPGFDRFRWPAKALQIVTLGMTLLAALGFDAILERQERADAPPDGTVAGILVAWSVLAAVICAAVFAVPGAESLAWAHPGKSDVLLRHTGEILRDQLRTLGFLALAIAAIGGVVHRPGRPIWRTLVVAGAWLNLLFVSREIHPTGDDSLLGAAPSPPAATAPAEPTDRIDTQYVSAGFMLYGNADPGPWHLATNLLAGEAGLPHAVHRTSASDALALTATSEVMDLIDRLPEEQAERLADILSIRWTIRGPAFAELLELRAWEPPASLRHSSRPAVPVKTLRPNALPRAYLADRWMPSGDRVDAMRRMLAPGFDLRREIVVDPAKGLPAAQPAREASLPGRVTSISVEPDEVRLRVEAVRPCVAVLTDTWYPGWVARVDGVVTPVLRVNVLFRGVSVPAGSHRVEFTYEPASFIVGAWISLVTLVGLSGLAAWGIRRRA